LPAQARNTVKLIQSRGPFPYSQDGVTFANAEGHLPKKATSYYHEYTVITPGESDRGARRIITGGSGEYYYTADHYDSFVRVDIQK
jgi:ribonuclease T1